MKASFLIEKALSFCEYSGKISKNTLVWLNRQKGYLKKNGADLSFEQLKVKLSF
jgi:hypothetical protein